MDAFRSREEALLARSAELETALAAERRRADAAERALHTARSFEAVSDVHVGIARGLLWATAAGYVIFVLVAFPAYIAIAHDEAKKLSSPFHGYDPILVGIGMAFVVCGFFLPVGVSAVVGAIGLRRGQRWGWVAAVITYGILAVTCTPIGAYGLFAFLRERVRQAFYPPPPSPFARPPAPPGPAGFSRGGSL